MAELRYNRTFKNGMAAILFCFLLFGSIFVYSIVAKIQYDSMVGQMRSVKATVVNYDWDMHIRGPREQIIYIAYRVDGVTYSRELKTDTKVSFEPGRGAHYLVGDKIDIFYDPDNPEVIASPRSVGVGYFYMGISLGGLALVTYALISGVRHRSNFLVTQEEYEKENGALRKSKEERKKRKRKKNDKARRVVKIVLIVLAVPVGAFVLFLLFGALLKACGY